MTGIVKDPYSGLELIELSHVWGHGVPSEPGQLDVRMVRAVKHAQHGVLAWRVTTSLHTGTHMNAPIHMVQRGDDLAAVSPDRLFGNAAVLDIPKKSWEVVTAADLEAATAGRRRMATSSSSSPAGITPTRTVSSTSARRPA